MSGNRQNRIRHIKTTSAARQPMHVNKRAKIAAATKLGDALPCLTGLPTEMDKESQRAILKKYFDASVKPNRFKYVSIIKSGTPNQVVDTLKDTGAFSSHNCRQALLELIHDARDAGTYRADCDTETLDSVERYAQCAFSLEDDHTIGCGNVNRQ